MGGDIRIRAMDIRLGQDSDMDQFRAMKTFIAVAETGRFSVAARKLGMSAPSITRVINDLETSLGVRLLHRTTRLVSLTAIGQRYLEDCRRIITDLEAANDAARGAHSAPKGLLRVTASTMFGQIYISPIIATYLDLYSDVRVEAIFVDRVVNMIEEGMDIAIRIGDLPDSSLMAVRVGQVQPVICGSPRYFERCGVPQKPGDLGRHNLIGLAFDNFHRVWSFDKGLSVQVAHRLTYSTVQAGLDAARAGYGLIRVLSYQSGPDLDRGELQTTLQEFAPPPVPIHVLHGEGRRSSAKIRSFVDLATEHLRRNPFIN